MYSSDPRKARIYDRLEGQEQLEVPRCRFAEVDAAMESLRPGAVVALAFDCDELLAARRSADSDQWVLATASTNWSSRGSSGWHTHAGDYAVESLEPDCLFRVLRDGKHIALASVVAGVLLCASSSGKQLGLTHCGSGGWAAMGASWEQRDGAICNSRWPDKVLAVCLLHITCLPTTQLQRVEEFYGGLMHELHAEKATAHKLVHQLEEERDAAVADARRWRHELVLVQEQLQLHQEDLAAAREAAQHGPTGQANVASQLATLQQQLESLAAEGSLPQLHQERARMSICLRTIKEITDLVRQSASTTPSSKGSPMAKPLAELGEDDGEGCSPAGHASQGPSSPVPYATAAEGESRLRDYLGERPEQADPLYRVLQPPAATQSPESPSRRVLQALALADSENIGDDVEGGSTTAATGISSAPAAGRKAAPCNPLLASLSVAMSQLAAGSPRQADGMAQFIATPSALHASHPQPQPKCMSPLRASQQQLKLRSSFLQRAPAAMEDLYSC